MSLRASVLPSSYRKQHAERVHVGCACGHIKLRVRGGGGGGLLAVLLQQESAWSLRAAKEREQLEVAGLPWPTSRHGTPAPRGRA